MSSQDKVQADASRAISTFTFIDAAHRGVILAKVQNYFNRMRFGNAAVDFIARSRWNDKKPIMSLAN
jgi:hypothetical protein